MNVEYTNDELAIILNNIIKNNIILIYRYTYKSDYGELRFVFRDKNYNHYEIDDKDRIVEFNYSEDSVVI